MEDLEKVNWVFDRINIIGDELEELKEIFLNGFVGENKSPDGELLRKLLQLSDTVIQLQKNLNVLTDKVIETRIEVERKQHPAK